MSSPPRSGSSSRAGPPRPPFVPILGGSILPPLSVLRMISDMMTADAILDEIDVADAISERREPVITVLGPFPRTEPSQKVVFESYKPEEKEWTEKNTKTKCKICMEDEKVVQCVFEPCSHALACRSCAEKLLSKRGKCPICNTKVTGCFKYRKQLLVQDDEEDAEEQEEQKDRGGEKKRVKRSASK